MFFCELADILTVARSGTRSQARQLQTRRAAASAQGAAASTLHSRRGAHGMSFGATKSNRQAAARGSGGIAPLIGGEIAPQIGGEMGGAAGEKMLPMGP